MAVMVSDLGSRCHRFDEQPFHCHVATLGKLTTHVPLPKWISAKWQQFSAAGKINCTRVGKYWAPTS